MKKIGFMTLLILATVLVTLAFPAVAAGPQSPAAPVVAAAPATRLAPAATALAPAVSALAPEAPAVAAMPEPPHPHIHQAIESMRAAKHHLESAEHDFAGHRAKAIEHLNQAIREAEICMEMK